MSAVGYISVARGPSDNTTMRDRGVFVRLFPALRIPTAGIGKSGGLAGCSPASAQPQEKSGFQRQRAACQCIPLSGTLADCLPALKKWHEPSRLSDGRLLGGIGSAARAGTRGYFRCRCRCMRIVGVAWPPLTAASACGIPSGRARAPPWHGTHSSSSNAIPRLNQDL
jgi:hypothetical protein